MFEEKLIVRNDNRDELFSELKKRRPHIVGIDGEDGAGKTTTIAPLIQELLGGTVLSLDNYLEKDCGGYIGHLHYDTLGQDLLDLVKKPELIIIEGVMLLDVLEKMEVNQDYLVYACSNMWLDDWTGEYGNHYERKTLEEIITHEESTVKLINAGYQMKGMRKEIYAYTYNQKPFSKADTIWIS